jgi:hypothetical protein
VPQTRKLDEGTVMRILAFDTSTANGVLTLLEGGSSVHEVTVESHGKHGDVLLPTIRDALAHAGWDVATLGAVMAGVGPGSFTGPLPRACVSRSASRYAAWAHLKRWPNRISPPPTRWWL